MRIEIDYEVARKPRFIIKYSLNPLEKEAIANRCMYGCRTQEEELKWYIYNVLEEASEVVLSSSTLEEIVDEK